MVVVTNTPPENTTPRPLVTMHPVDEHPVKVRKNPLTEEAYRNITSSMRAEPLEISSPKTALQLLSTAIKLQNMPLVNECIKNLDQFLEKDNVLMIYSHLAKCKMPKINKNDFEPSAPPIIENENQRGTDWVEELINNLRLNCLLFIDKEADSILKKKETLDLNYTDLYQILSRDTLEVSNEVTVYCAMYNWGIAKCNRMTLNTKHLGDVLRDLRHTPRYGLMPKKDFCSRTIGSIRGPTKSGVLDEKEWREIKFYIEQKSKVRDVKELPDKMSQSRVVGKQKPIILSCKSSTRYENRSGNAGTNYPGKGKCDKFFINFLTCFTAVFD